MVRRLLAAMLVLCCLALWGSLAVADDGITPPPIDTANQRLADKYPPETLRFESAPGWKYGGLEWISNIEAAIFYAAAVFVKWTGRAMDYAIHFNVARWVKDLIDPINTRMSNNLWAWGGTIFTLIGVWLVMRFWRNQYTQMSGELLALAIALMFAVWVNGGIGDWLADMDDAGSEVMTAVMNVGSDKTSRIHDDMINIEDGLYRQLILEPWARANFTSLEAASKPDYMKNGIPGDVFLGKDVEAARKVFEDLRGVKNEDLAPWYTNSAMTTRGGVAIVTLLTSILFLIVLLVCSLLVLGAEGIGIMFAFGLPFATWIASMPWFAGIRFLKGYFVLVLLAPIVKIIAGLGMAMYLAFVSGLMDAAPRIQGGWTVVTLLVVAVLVAGWFLAKPIFAVLGKLFFIAPAARQVNQAKGATAQRNGNSGRTAGGQQGGTPARRRPPAQAPRRPLSKAKLALPSSQGAQQGQAAAASGGGTTGRRPLAAGQPAATSPGTSAAAAGGNGTAAPGRRQVPRRLRPTIAPVTPARTASAPSGVQGAQQPVATGGRTRKYRYQVRRFIPGVGEIVAYKLLEGRQQPGQQVVRVVAPNAATQPQQADQVAKQAAQRPHVLIHRHYHQHQHQHTQRGQSGSGHGGHSHRQAPARPVRNMELTEVLRVARMAVQAMQKIANAPVPRGGRR